MSGDCGEPLMSVTSLQISHAMLLEPKDGEQGLKVLVRPGQGIQGTSGVRKLVPSVTLGMHEP